jgi:hypothetical protein
MPVIFVGDPALLPVWLAEMVLLALAAPVFALSINFLKKPGFFALGVIKPPRPPVVLLSASSHPIADFAPCLESWVEWNETPVVGVVGRKSVCSHRSFLIPALVIGLATRARILPILFLARLPALVALKAPAEYPLMRL